MGPFSGTDIGVAKLTPHLLVFHAFAVHEGACTARCIGEAKGAPPCHLPARNQASTEHTPSVQCMLGDTTEGALPCIQARIQARIQELLSSYYRYNARGRLKPPQHARTKDV